MRRTITELNIRNYQEMPRKCKKMQGNSNEIPMKFKEMQGKGFFLQVVRGQNDDADVVLES